MRSLVLLVLVLAWCGCGGGGSDPAPGPHAARGQQSLFFDGADDRVTVPLASWGATPFPNGLTVEAWIRPQTLGVDSEYAGIVRAGPHSLTLDNSGAGRDQTGLVQTILTGVVATAQSPLDTLRTGVWQHVAGTYDGTTIRLYVNGNLVGSQGHAGTANGATEVTMGAWTTSFHGAIDEVRIWNVVRSQAALANSMSVAFSGSEAGLIGYYRFEGAGQTVVDGGPAGAHGTLGATGAVESSDPSRVAN